MGACDSRTQGGFNWSTQRLVMEVVRDGCGRAREGGLCDAWSDRVAGSAVGGAAGGSCAVLAVDRGRRLEHGCRGCCRRVTGGWEPGGSGRGGGAAHLVGPAVGGVSVVC